VTNSGNSILDSKSLGKLLIEQPDTPASVLLTGDEFPRVKDEFCASLGLN